MTRQEFVIKVRRMSEEMSEDNLTALSKMRDLLIREHQDGRSVNLLELKADVKPEVLASLFVAQDILGKLDANFGIESSAGILPGGEEYLEEIARNLGRAIQKSSSLEAPQDVARHLGRAYQGYGWLIYFTEDPDGEPYDPDTVQHF